MGEALTDDQLLAGTYFCSSWSEVVELIAKYRDIGATQIVLPSGPDKNQIRTYRDKILPHFKRVRRKSPR